MLATNCVKNRLIRKNNKTRYLIFDLTDKNSKSQSCNAKIKAHLFRFIAIN